MTETPSTTPPPTSTGKGLSRYDGPRSTAELHQYAALLAGTTLGNGNYRANDALPAIFRGNPAAIAFASEYAKAIDVSPITAVMGLHMIDGKPSASAGLISALVRRGGHRIRTWTEGSVEGGDLKAITTIVRIDDPEFTYKSEWTLARAVRAGLCSTAQGPDGRWTVTARGRSGKPGGWETYTENLAKARSITECARDAAEDALLGVHYTPEELGAEIDEAGEPVYTVTTVGAPPQGQAADPVPPTGDTPVDQRVHAEPDDLAAMATEASTKLLEILENPDLDNDEAQARILADVWGGGQIASARDRATMLVTADADGVEVNMLELLTLAGNALKAEGDEPRAALLARFGIVPVDDGDPADPTTRPETPDDPAQEADGPDQRPENHGPNRRALNAALEHLTDDQRAVVYSYLRAWDLDPLHDDTHAAKAVEAIRNDTIAGLRNTQPDPVGLIESILGGTEIEDRPPTPAEAAKAALAEDRAEHVEEARPDPSDSGRAARDEARRVARAAKESDQR